MKVIETELQDVKIIEPKVFGDERGFFFESFNAKAWEKCGITVPFVQDNHSKSIKGVLRGLHFQIKKPQGKLVRVLQGEVLDVIVDTRIGSPTFGKWISILISSEKKNQVWVPPGLAHGFSVLSDTAEFAYKVTDYYDPTDEGGIIWNDPSLNIDWKVESPSLSAKDIKLPQWDEAKKYFPVYSDLMRT